MCLEACSQLLYGYSSTFPAGPDVDSAVFEIIIEIYLFGFQCLCP